jgi:hypothetical protein
MELFSLKSNEIPEHFCVIRFKNTKNYLHADDGILLFKEKLHGCFVCLPEVIEDILTDLKQIKLFNDLEIVKFKDAYKQHGLIERQIAYN